MNSPMIYELRRPQQIVPNQTYPALFVMHGMGSNEQDLLSLVEELKEQVYIFSIRGHLEQPPGYAYFTIQGLGKPHRDAFDLAVGKMTSFIDYATQQYPIDQNRLYLLGFSQGAILSMTLGLALGDRIKGIIALSGYIPAFVKEDYAVKPVNHLSLFISHGVYDPVLPYEWGVENQVHFKKLGAAVSFHTYQEGHTVSLQNYQDFMKWIQESLKK
ncbi:alpha/beta hydrolase [Brevibacillus migulae]|uniref:alpha/beta hydrolase n=1 Tax=Brevibacillus migulae TaxID=1644114 RepID=UPI00106E278A|nr:alpha/beta hydrolase [Brevibacillus migulae]